MSEEAGRQDSISLIDELAKAPPEPAPEGTTSLQMHAFLAVAMAKHREGQLSEAEQMYRQALRWQPDHPDAYHLLGLLAAQLNRSADALPLFERAIALNPTVPEYYANYGNALMIASRIAEAEAAFAKAISLRSNFPEALMNLATVRRNRGDLESAERLLLPCARAAARVAGCADQPSERGPGAATLPRSNRAVRARPHGRAQLRPCL